MGVKYFEDLEVWKSARELTDSIYSITADGAFSKDYGLRDQIRRAAVSGNAEYCRRLCHKYLA